MSQPEAVTSQGPYVTAAFLCEKVLYERDGVPSAIRIVSRITQAVVGRAAPPTLQPFDVRLYLFLALKTGWARGRHPLRVFLDKPAPGSRVPVVEQTVTFEGEEDRGVDVVGQIVLTCDQEGIYWFSVMLDDRLLTRLPLRVVYTSTVTQQPGAA